MPSLVAEIGEVVENHSKATGLLPEDKLDEHQRAFLAKKKQELAGNDDPDGDFPTSAQLCGKCHTKAVIFADGCMACLSCGDSKCS